MFGILERSKDFLASSLDPIGETSGNKEEDQACRDEKQCGGKNGTHHVTEDAHCDENAPWSEDGDEGADTLLDGDDFAGPV